MSEAPCAEEDSAFDRVFDIGAGVLKAGVPSVLAEAGGIDELDVESQGRVMLCLTTARARHIGGGC